MFSPDKTWYDNHAKRNSYNKELLIWQNWSFQDMYNHANGMYDIHEQSKKSQNDLFL